MCHVIITQHWCNEAEEQLPVWPLEWSHGWWSAPRWRGTVCPYWWVWQWRRCSSWPLRDSASKQIHPQPAGNHDRNLVFTFSLMIHFHSKCSRTNGARPSETAVKMYNLPPLLTRPWLSGNMTIIWALWSQIILQKSVVVWGKGCWVMMNSLLL